MTLDQWSMIFFLSVVVWSLAGYWSMFYSPTISRFIVVGIAWLVHFIASIAYGFVTNQIGFKLLPFFEVMMLFFTYLSIAKVMQNDN